jgi:hypothetical protein
LKRSPIPVLRRLALAVERVLAQLAGGSTPIHAVPGEPALVISGRTGGAAGANMAGTCRTRGLARLPHEQMLGPLGTSVRGPARQSVPGPRTSR